MCFSNPIFLWNKSNVIYRMFKSYCYEHDKYLEDMLVSKILETRINEIDLRKQTDIKIFYLILHLDNICY